MDETEERCPRKAYSVVVVVIIIVIIVVVQVVHTAAART